MSLDRFLLLINAHGLPPPQLEFRFLPDRLFRADYCWPEAMCIVEKMGQIWHKGGHNTGTGLLRDYEKANLAQLAGYLYLQFTPQQLESGAALPVLKIVLEKGGSGDGKATVAPSRIGIVANPRAREDREVES